jgi:hypothetical protein
MISPGAKLLAASYMRPGDPVRKMFEGQAMARLDVLTRVPHPGPGGGEAQAMRAGATAPKKR